MMMKRIFACILLAMASLSAFAADSKGYNIKLNVTNSSMANQKVYLAFYFNGKTYSKDTTTLNNKGVGYFSKKTALDQGVYIVYFDANKFFDVLIGADQNLELKIDTAKLDKVVVSGAKESVGFQNLINFMGNQREKSKELSQQYKDKKIDSVKYANGQDKLAEEVEAFQKKLMDENKGLWLEAFIKGTIPVEVPDMKEVPDSARALARYMYKKHHYFDNINLSDPRFLRCPYFPNNVDSYMKNYLLQHPDTLYEAAVVLIEKSRYNKETFQTMCSKMINYGLTSNQMGMDALWCKLAQKYYLGKPRQATWADSAWVEDLRKEVKKVRYNLVGMEAKDLRMQDANGTPTKLSDLTKNSEKNKFVLAYFFEPTCGHCRKTTPILHDSVYSKYHKLGFEVFCVYTQTDKNEWQEFVEKHKLQDWVNVWDPDRESYFWEFYDASVTPGIYLIESKTGKIIAKKIDMPTLGMILEEELIKRPEAEAKKKSGKK
ncbi:MAG: AhpC/TSA family protein [Paludibacteraceae bacterium]|nr:AhpC/TSA family protein [Paludibacteraceae bacterium]MBR6041621.1 AhpC/TSA family protein [Paludibacteraceae bacterium]